MKANLTHGDLGAEEKLRERGMKRSGKRTTKFSWHLPCKSVCISGSLMVYNRNIPWVFLHERPLIERIELRESAKGLKTTDIRGVWGSGLRTGWLTWGPLIPFSLVSLTQLVSEESTDWSNEATCLLPDCRRGDRYCLPPRPHSSGKGISPLKELGALGSKPTS